MRWRENWRFYLTPGDGLLISLLEEFLSKSVSFINDISLCSVRHLLSSQKGNYLFRPGNNISYCLSSRARRGAKRRRKRETGQRAAVPKLMQPGSLNAPHRCLPLCQRARVVWMQVCECVRMSVCVWVCVYVCVWGCVYECMCVRVVPHTHTHTHLQWSQPLQKLQGKCRSQAHLFLRSKATGFRNHSKNECLLFHSSYMFNYLNECFRRY